MILNVPSVVSLFLSGLGALLALATLVVGSRAYVSLRRSPDGSRSRAIDDRLHLLVILLGVLGVVRLLAWPHFYLMLKSYVDELALFRDDAVATA